MLRLEEACQNKKALDVAITSLQATLQRAPVSCISWSVSHFLYFDSIEVEFILKVILKTTSDLRNS